MWEVQGKGAACVVRGTGWAVCGVWARVGVAQCAASPAGSLAFEEMGEWCRECSSAEAVPAEARAREGELWWSVLGSSELCSRFSSHRLLPASVAWSVFGVALSGCQ